MFAKDKPLAKELVSKSILFLDTDNILTSDEHVVDKKQNKSYNHTECDAIKSLCKFFIKVRDVRGKSEVNLNYSFFFKAK